MNRRSQVLRRILIVIVSVLGGALLFARWPMASSGLDAQAYTSSGDIVSRFHLFSISAQASVGRFIWPKGIDIASDGSVYLVDTLNCRIQRFDAAGVWLGAWGSCGNEEGKFSDQRGIAVAPDGSIYVADTGNSRIQRFTADGEFLGAWQGAGDRRLYEPLDVAVALDGTVYVVDGTAHRVQYFSPEGDLQGQWGTQGDFDGGLGRPSSLAVSAGGYVYVVDMWNDRIQVFTSDGRFVRKWGETGNGDGAFDAPVAIALAANGTVYVLDRGNNRIQYFDLDGTFKGAWSLAEQEEADALAASPTGTVYVVQTNTSSMASKVRRYSSGGVLLGEWTSSIADETPLIAPYGVAIGANDNVYVADAWSHRVPVFTKDGRFLRTLGTDGQFFAPRSVETGPDGSVYVGDGHQQIQRFTADGTFSSAWGSPGSGDGELLGPSGIAVSSDGTVYVVDTMNQRVQHFTADGTFLRKWGGAGRGDGEFFNPQGIDVAPSGEVYVSDFDNRIQRFSQDGLFLGKFGTFGSGRGQFNLPAGLAFGADNFYVADMGNNRVQQFSLDGTWLGSWGEHGGGVGQFSSPRDVAVASDGTVYVADMGNHRVQVFGTAYLDQWRGEFFDNDWLTGPPVAVQYTDTLNFDWLDGSPLPGIASDHFSDRWSRYVYFEAGWYTFSLKSDDGIRVWIDEQLVLDSWKKSVATFSFDMFVPRGYHRILIEHWENVGDASLVFSWQPTALYTETVTLPVVTYEQKAFSGPWEEEKNNWFSSSSANGPLYANQAYYGYFDDQDDIFWIFLPTDGTIRVELENQAEQDVQLILYDEELQIFAVAYDAPYELTYSPASKGVYYIRVYNAGNTNQTTPYVLWVRYP
nr:6-bladed beta-propeller [Ardenticatena sp.]